MGWSSGLGPSAHFLVARSPDVIALQLANPVNFVAIFEYEYNFRLGMPTQAEGVGGRWKRWQ